MISWLIFYIQNLIWVKWTLIFCDLYGVHCEEITNNQFLMVVLIKILLFSCIVSISFPYYRSMQLFLCCFQGMLFLFFILLYHHLFVTCSIMYTYFHLSLSVSFVRINRFSIWVNWSKGTLFTSDILIIRSSYFNSIYNMLNR
jgi:hypothetical protein